MRMTGTWNDFAVERAESRKEICANIVANDDCFEVRISAKGVGCLQSHTFKSYSLPDGDTVILVDMP